MSLIKKLASDTAAYGISSILARLINFVFGFLIIKYITNAEYGVYGKFYAFAGFILVLLTHGMETAFFRHYNKTEYKEKAFATAFTSIFIVAVLYVFFSHVFARSIASWVEEPTLYVSFFTWMMAFDVLAALPFASLRATNRPIHFAALKIVNILIFIVCNILFFIVFPYLSKKGIFVFWDNLTISNVSFIFIANLIASAVTFLLLLGQLKYLKGGFDSKLYKRMLQYSLPIMLVGFAGMINEMLDRAMMTKLLPFDKITNDIQLGIYSFNYKFSMLMTLFLQAYRYAAEPFFFAHAQKSDSKKVYADTMRFFVICGCLLFLLITLNITLIQKMFLLYSPNASDYFVGAKVIPILLLANLCLGIYFNISTWYKITDKTHIGALISVFGALITLALNFYWIPRIGYMGSAWATLICYASMVIVGWLAEEKYYPIQYDYKRIGWYITLSVALFFSFNFLQNKFGWPLPVQLACAAAFLLIYLANVFISEKKLRKKPVVEA